MTEPLDDIVQLARGNDAFRREIAARHSQIVAMTIPMRREIGDEVHEENDQLLVFVDGEGEAVLDGKTSRATWSWFPPAATASSTPATAPSPPGHRAPPEPPPARSTRPRPRPTPT